MNPPYFDKETVYESKSHYQSITKYHGGSNLDKWINNSLQLLKFKGTITIINKIENSNIFPDPLLLVEQTLAL